MGRTLALWIAGATAFALVVELLLRILPVSSSTETDYYMDSLILTYPPHHRWITATGWDLRNAQTLQANNMGFLAHRDFTVNSRAVALIGDSFAESSMLVAPDRPGAQLERSLSTRPVFSAGSPGTALLDYAERIRFMHQRFGVRDFVVLAERGDILQSLCGSGNVHGPCLDPKTLAARVESIPKPGLAKRLLRHSALAQYLVSQLAFSPGRLWKHLGQTPHAISPNGKDAIPHDARGDGQASPDPMLPAVEAVTRLFFERIQPYMSGRLVIVLDSDRQALFNGRPSPDVGRSRFIELARAAGATVVDTEPLVARHFSHSALKLDVGPYDGHLNRAGVALYMQAAAAELANR